MSNVLDLELIQIQYCNVQDIFSDEPFAQCAVSLKYWFIWKTLSGRLRELKTKEKSSWVIPKVVAVAYESF